VCGGGGGGSSIPLGPSNREYCLVFHKPI